MGERDGHDDLVSLQERASSKSDEESHDRTQSGVSRFRISDSSLLALPRAPHIRDQPASLHDEIKKKMWIEPAARTVYAGVISIDTLRWTLRTSKKEER